MAKSILFVCTGNTCRSYMAEVITKHILSQLKDKTADIKVYSAGTGALEGAFPSSQAQEVLNEFGCEPGCHRSKLLTPQFVRETDLILVMTQRHKEQVLRLEPSAENKVFLLKEYAADHKEEAALPEDKPCGIDTEIMDPFGQPVETYRACAGELREHIIKALDKFLLNLKKSLSRKEKDYCE